MNFTKKYVWLLFPVLSASLFVPAHLHRTPNAVTMQADGTEPPPRPFPWPTGTANQAQTNAPSTALHPVLSADGTEPPPRPFPWSTNSASVLTADGTEPPPPPFPWPPNNSQLA
jgi:hypothetical protein